MELSNTAKARLVTGAATIVNATVAATLFDSKAISAYHAITGGAATVITEVPEGMKYGAKEAAVHGASMVVGGTLQTAVYKTIGNLIFGSNKTEESDNSDELDSVITEVTGLVNPSKVEAEA